MRSFKELVKKQISESVEITESTEKAKKIKEPRNKIVETKEAPLQKLRNRGFIIKNSVPTKTGKKIFFYKKDTASEALEVLEDFYEDEYEIEYDNKLTITLTLK